MVDFFKSNGAKLKVSAPPTPSKSDALRQKRLAHEQAQKAAGIWGDMSVGTVSRDDRIFVYFWKGNIRANLSDLATKKPKEMTDDDHAAFLRWLKNGQFDGFIQAFVAWNVSAEEAAKIKSELVTKYRDEGKNVVNHQ